MYIKFFSRCFSVVILEVKLRFDTNYVLSPSVYSVSGHMYVCTSVITKPQIMLSLVSKLMSFTLHVSF